MSTSVLNRCVHLAVDEFLRVEKRVQHPSGVIRSNIESWMIKEQQAFSAVGLIKGSAEL
ncbi:hypothetical protein KIN20_037298 [Parelaphostrongylus tenuis]|uniref:Uncharacterized protein n=1 Tax=Parelaphostrongylus tenuis TaxID=148309 RepID=A0AAD5WLX6_PARTN|nr:hypothetical protein KIN20_037298 [Parelaphostrongylus tenuis]